jgi:hypothetical protein
MKVSNDGDANFFRASFDQCNQLISFPAGEIAGPDYPYRMDEFLPLHLRQSRISVLLDFRRDSDGLNPKFSHRKTNRSPLWRARNLSSSAAITLPPRCKSEDEGIGGCERSQPSSWF